MKFLWIALIVLASIMLSFLLPVKFLLNFTNDDSFFYIKTAYNFSAGYGSTFDGSELTNGYHPLWFLILSAYYFILNVFTEFSPGLYFRFTVLLICLICALTLYVINKTLKVQTAGNGKRYFILFIPLYFLFVLTRDFGLETHLVCLIIAVYLLIKSIELKSGRSFAGLKGLVIIFLFLARTDFLVTFIPMVIISDYYTSMKTGRRKFLITSVSCLIVIAALYHLSNLIFFGSPVSISAAVKNSFPELILFKNVYELTFPGLLTNQFIKTVYLVAVILAFGFLLKSKKTREKFSDFDYFIFGLCIGAFLFLLFNLSFNFHSLKEWYVAISSFVASLLLIRLLMLYGKYYYGYLILFILMFLYHFNLTRLQNYKWDSAYDYALKLKEQTQPSDKIFQIDLCGIVGFFSERMVVNGDGLINNFEYRKYYVSDSLGKYFIDKDIKYYSTHSTDKGIFSITLKDGVYTEEFFKTKNFGGYNFSFPENKLKFKYPYYYSFAVSEDKGYWYLFEIGK